MYFVSPGEINFHKLSSQSGSGKFIPHFYIVVSVCFLKIIIMKYLILFIITFFFTSYSQQSVHNNPGLGTLRYVGICNSTDDAMDKLRYGYPRSINFSVSPGYHPKYPNPFSPSVIPNNAFVLHDTSDIKIELLNTNGETIINFSSEKNPKGYYQFTYNYSLSKVDSLNIRVCDDDLRFTINDSTYVVPLIPH